MNSQASYERKDLLQHLNIFLKAMNMDVFSTNDRARWQTYSDKQKSRYTCRFTSIIDKIINVVFPLDHEAIVKMMFHSDPDDNTSIHQPVSIEGNFGPLVEYYKNSTTWQQQRQTLSLLTVVPYVELVKQIPSLTEYRYYAAKTHASHVGPGLPVNQRETQRRYQNYDTRDRLCECSCFQPPIEI